VFISFPDETCEQHRMSNCMGHLNQTKTNEGKTILKSGITGSHCPIIEYHITKNRIHRHTAAKHPRLA